jgi:tRNA uracil 4-sulfurtransferase
MPSAPSSSERAPARRSTIILRYGEIFLKGKNRRDFERALVDNARRLVADLPGVAVRPSYLRAEVLHPPELERACLERLARLFGLHSMSPARVAPRDLDGLTAAAIEAARALPAGQRFKVETRRRDKRYPMNSVEVSQHVGGHIAEQTSLVPDMHHPQHTIHLEIDTDQALLFPRIVPGPGGLPVGTAGRVGVLLSGGIDSPVAAWSAMRRGCTIEPIYFHSFPYTGDKTKEKVADLCRVLTRWHGPFTLHVVHFTEVQKQLRAAGPADYAVVLYRRMMMRAASIVAARLGCKALVTGENLGQVASQTLENLGVIEAAATLPVLRPLVTFDKLEIISRAQAIGTFELSIQPYDDCCSLFVPSHPVTKARREHAERAEAKLDIDALATQLADSVERIELG